jgi:hypothetical protein
MATPFEDADLKMTPLVAWGFSSPVASWISRHETSSYYDTVPSSYEQVSDCRWCDQQTHYLSESFANYNAHHVDVFGVTGQIGAKVKAVVQMDAFCELHNRVRVSTKFIPTGQHYSGPDPVQSTVRLYDADGNKTGDSVEESLGGGLYGVKKYTCEFKTIPA